MEVVGHLMVEFQSSAPFRLNIDEYGIGAKQFDSELMLEDAQGNRYFARMDKASVFIDGDVLWKVL